MDRSKQALAGQSKPPGADFLQLDIADAPAGGRSGWLAAQVRLAVADGGLAAGSRLPASRVLAAELGVSRGVVTEAYQRLSEDGHVTGHGRAGTVVTAAITGAGTAGGTATGAGSVTAVPAVPRGPAAPGADGLFGGPPGSAVFEEMRAAPARIDLSPGLPDLAAFPHSAWLRAERAALGALRPADLGYGDPRGMLALRGAVAGWLARTRGIRADPAEVIIVAGVSQGLGLLGQALRADGIGAVAVEEPGSLGVRQHLANWQLDTPPVPVDAAGLRVSDLRASGARAVMVTPAHQFPTGAVLSGPRRQELLAWAAAGGLIIEDDYDAEHRYDRPPVPALRATASHVCYLGSVSKLLAPALRLGWMLPPHRYAGAVLAAKRNADLGNAALPQLALARLIESGDLERQLRFLRRRHRRRRDAMIEAVARHLPGATVHGAAAGLHLMITFRPEAGLPSARLAAAALRRGVKVQPLSWHRQRPPPGLVLGYAASPPAAITEGIAILGDAAAELAAGRAGS